ncbi:MAG: PDZ domain-containing protein, partial [Halomonadaceae bacterium]|nr:PDZ domain-containing protein [Halomonadaceae bacterium]
DEQGVAVHAIMQDSVAQAAGLEAGDIIQRAAGKSLTRTDELVRLVQRQIPGTLLPLDILRNGQEQEVLVRFPAAPGG